MLYCDYSFGFKYTRIPSLQSGERDRDCKVLLKLMAMRSNCSRLRNVFFHLSDQLVY